MREVYPSSYEVIDYQIRVVDRQDSNNGRVYNHVNRTVRSTRYGRIVR